MRRSLVLDLDVHFLGLGQHGNRGCRGMDAALSFGGRHALHPVHAGFELQPREHALAGDRGGGVAEAADIVGRDFHRLEPPALQTGVFLVHGEQVAGEQRRFVRRPCRARTSRMAFLSSASSRGSSARRMRCSRLRQLRLQRLQIVSVASARHLRIQRLVRKHRLQVFLLGKPALRFGDGFGHRSQLGILLRVLAVIPRRRCRGWTAGPKVLRAGWRRVAGYDRFSRRLPNREEAAGQLAIYATGLRSSSAGTSHIFRTVSVTNWGSVGPGCHAPSSPKYCVPNNCRDPVLCR